jgi:acyl carrier protein
MTREEVFARLKEVIGIIRPGTDITNVTMETELVRGLGIDSLSMMLMALAIEEKFKMRFPPDSAPVTVSDVCDIILSAL